MAKYATHKGTTDGKRQTIERRTARALKRGATRTNRAGRITREGDAR